MTSSVMRPISTLIHGQCASSCRAMESLSARWWSGRSSRSRGSRSRNVDAYLGPHVAVSRSSRSMTTTSWSTRSSGVRGAAWSISRAITSIPISEASAIEAGQKHRRGRRHYGQPYGATWGRPEGLHIGVRTVQCGEDLVGAGHERLTCLGETHTAAVGFEQLDAGLTLKPLELLGHRRGRQGQCLGGRLHRAVLGEVAQQAQAFHVHEVNSKQFINNVLLV